MSEREDYLCGQSQSDSRTIDCWPNGLRFQKIVGTNGAEMALSARSKPSTRLLGGLLFVSEAVTPQRATSRSRKFLTAVSTCVCSPGKVQVCACLWAPEFPGEWRTNTPPEVIHVGSHVRPLTEITRVLRRYCVLPTPALRSEVPEDRWRTWRTSCQQLRIFNLQDSCVPVHPSSCLDSTPLLSFFFQHKSTAKPTRNPTGKHSLIQLSCVEASCVSKADTRCRQLLHVSRKLQVTKFFNLSSVSLSLSLSFSSPRN